ncbi:hypothetical protein IQ224_20550 [Microcystis sp. LEGE 00066]|uniref:hypothetical protein n=1 Tax=Microcystis sp. LEGE 00066 TaxID=1828685 RepID=UPI0018821929|nr:hypothetical protein [Microcystis sp. LEGE 00066]MBE9264420.1 hypothetical protein [Microcystis sp. LEGE 00066]
MTVKELIQTAIDNLPEEQLDELYQLIKNFTASKNNLLEEKSSLFKRRFPVENMVDKAKILGDMVSPIVDEEDWECLK